MDTNSVTFTGILTLQDALDLHRYRSLCYLRRSFWWLIGTVSFVLASTCIVIISFGKGIVPIWLILILCIYIPCGWWFERRWMVRRQYRRHPEYYVENTVAVDAENLSVSNESMNMRLAWKHIAFILHTPRGLLFVVRPLQVLCWLPQRLFEGNDHKNAVFEYARQNNISVKTMK